MPNPIKRICDDIDCEFMKRQMQEYDELKKELNKNRS